jgi:CHAT domain-containing protein
MQVQLDREYIDQQMSKGNWQLAEKRLTIARKRALIEFRNGKKDVGEELCLFDYQLGMINQLIHGRFLEAERLYKEALSIVAGLAESDFVWWQPDALRAVVLRWLASVYMREGQVKRSISTLTELSDIEEQQLAQQVVKFPTIERDEEAGVGGAVLGGQVGSLIVANMAVSLAARLHFANRQANDLSFQTVLRTKGRQSDLVEAGTAFFRTQSPEQFSLYSRYLSLKTAFAIDYWINKSDPGRLKSEIDRLKREADTTKGAVASLMLSARQATPQRSPTLGATPDRVSARLPRNSVLLEYFVFRPYAPAATEDNGQYVWRSPRYGVYVIDSAQELHVLDLGDANEIDALIEDFRTMLGQPGPMTAVERVGRKLADKVWTPVSPYFRDEHDVFVAPDGKLNLVPFGALVSRHHMFLIHDITFHYLSSGRELLNLDTHEKPRQPPFLAASPCFDDVSKCGAERDVASGPKEKACQSLSPAPASTRAATSRSRAFDPVTDIFDAADISESRREACDIRNLFSSATFVEGARVTEQTVKEVHGPAILHLATHAYYIRSTIGEVDQDLLSDETLQVFRMRVQSFKYPDTWHPGKTTNRFGPFLEDLTLELDPFVRSGLALSGANEHISPGGEDGILTALETSALDLIGTELVVLSACDTGLGDVVSRGGLTGLRRSISIAGAQSQVISLWSVNDSATRVLMIEYYQRLLRGEGRAEALRRAQLSMLEAPDGAIRHPFYWAAFIESGAWGPLSATTLQWRRQTPSVSNKERWP